MKPRTTVVVAAALFALAAVIAIVVVAFGGGGGRGHQHSLSVGEAVDYGVDVRSLGVDDLLRDQRAAAAVQPRPRITVTMAFQHVSLVAVGLAETSTHEIDFAGRPPEDTWEEIKDMLRGYYAQDDLHETEVVVEASPDVPHGDVVQLMEAAKSIGFTHLALSTR